MKLPFYEWNSIVIFHCAARRITVNKNGHNCLLCPLITPQAVYLLIEINPVVFYSC